MPLTVRSSSQHIAEDLASLQKILLPQHPPSMPGYQLAVHYRPCEAAGGDFYGWGDRGDGYVGMGVADVAGHGLRAAVVMAMLRTWMAAFPYTNQPMSSLATHLNTFFKEIGGLQTFVTIVLMKLNVKTGEYAIRNCGHPLPRHRKCDGFVERLDQGRMLPLGVGEDEVDVPEATGILQPGEAIVFYTDGITESVGKDRSFFDDDRLDQAIAVENRSAESILQNIVQSVDNHRKNTPQRDDECILVIRREAVDR